MKLLLHCHSYALTATSGADIYAERICTWLGDRCNIRVIIDNCPAEYRYKNHIVASNKVRIAENYEWCDIVLTNLVTNNQAIQLAQRFKRPIFHIVHNDKMPTIEAIPNTNIIYNSYWLKNSRPLNFPSIVVQPPTWCKDWRLSPLGEYVTLINLTHNKGAQTLYGIAQAMPRQKFLAVVGGYGQQYMQPLPNIRRVPFTRDMQSIYDQTKVLIVPSIRESWSLCAAEAQACGIPVVCNDLPGLRENLGDTAVYASGVRGYMDALQSDLQPYIERGLQNAIEKEKNHNLQLENLYSFMENVLNKAAPVVVKSEYKREKVEKILPPEKKEFKPVREKKIINKPGTKQ